jgi:hypothetical protein
VEFQDQPFFIHYSFVMQKDGARREFEISLDHHMLLSEAPLDKDLPAWTRLEFHQCPSCHLDPRESPFCPTAARLQKLVAEFSATYSCDTALVQVRTPEREIRKETSVSSGLSSLLGVYMVTSGCPVLGKLRPMVRFHLPFATIEETLFRSVATYLVGQYLRQQRGLAPDWRLDGLMQTYREVERVNRAFAQRLQAAVAADANLNALIRLDLFARSFPESVADKLEQFWHLFERT